MARPGENVPAIVPPEGPTGVMQVRVAAALRKYAHSAMVEISLECNKYVLFANIFNQKPRGLCVSFAKLSQFR